ncbi:MAG: protein kinase [Candidatus Cloacimonetes bacterium]|nr:protein kinase [Candidatus Cloacimonadota bacterium]
MLAPGSMVSGYRIEEMIGKGGMGAVYRARDTALDRVVAIKALNPDLSANSDFIRRFRNEAQIQAKLNHPNIVGLFALIEEFGTHYMVMEFATGRTLKDLIHSVGPIPEKRAIPILNQILNGLGFAHQRGILHRDIKPSNIIVDKDDNVKILDFGIARVMGEQGMTRTGQNIGTVYYMSPEQVRAEKDIDARSDIFSLGITFYEMLTGRTPYNVDTASDYTIMDEIVNKPLENPRKYYEFISDLTITVLQVMTKKRREDRFASCEAVLNALQGMGPVRPAQSTPPPIVQSQQPAYQPVFETPAGPPPKTYMTQAVLATIFCCLPFGIVAIVNSSQASSAVKEGNYERAKMYARKAMTFINISVILGIIVFALNFAIGFFDAFEF